MKTIMNTTIVMMAISLTGCATPARSVSSTHGRIIEFKSGPEGFDTRTFFYEGASEVIAFDAQFTPDLAQKSIARLREFTDKPITWLVITHPNPDKFNGASVFKRVGAKVISSQSTAAAIPGVHAYKEYFFVEMAKMFKKGEYPQPVPVDQTFEGDTELVLKGGERIQLRELAKPGVSSTQTVAYIPHVKALMVGDLVHHQAHAWLEGGIVDGKPSPTLTGWIADLKELAKTYPADANVFGGRGKTVDLKTAVPAQIDYLKKAEALVRKDIQDRGAQVPDFKALAAQFEKAFPGFALSYMIEYGAYGLVQAESAK
jgi:glyoxylase-like metal-dependent hydrolase (beta-lactamase superfamily II)